jgi:hypothetical protein
MGNINACYLLLYSNYVIHWTILRLKKITVAQTVQNPKEPEVSFLCSQWPGVYDLFILSQELSSFHQNYIGLYLYISSRTFQSIYLRVIFRNIPFFCAEEFLSPTLTGAIISAGGPSIAIPVAGCGGPQDCETSRLPHFLDSRLTDGGEVVSLTRRSSFTPQEDSWYSFLLEAETTPVIMRLEVLGQLKNAITSPGNEPVTFRLVA